MYANAFPATQIIEFDPKYTNSCRSFSIRFMWWRWYQECSIDWWQYIHHEKWKSDQAQIQPYGGSVGLFEGRNRSCQKPGKIEREIKEFTKKMEDIRIVSLTVSGVERLRNNSWSTDMRSTNAVKLVSDEFISVNTKQEQFNSMLSSDDLRREDILEKIDTLTRDGRASAKVSMHTRNYSATMRN